MKVVELFSGTGNMAEAFRKAGHTVITVDAFEQADIMKDIEQVTPEEIIALLGGRPDVIWASPPCTAFSVCVISKNWDNGYAKSENAMLGIRLLTNALRLIMQLKPKWWYIENPRGMMRKLPIMQFLPRRTFTFCQYGDNAMKPTDVWTNNMMFWPKACKAGSPCHDAQPRNYSAKKDINAHKNMGTQGKNNAKDRGALPPLFCEYVVEASR